MDKIDKLKSISSDIISLRNDSYIHKGLDYNRQTMSKVLNRLQKVISSSLEPLNSKYLNLNIIKNKGLDTAKYMSFISSLEQGKEVIPKSAKYSDRDFLDQLGNLLSSNKSLTERQLDIEKYCLAYDQNWFESDFSSYQGKGQGVPIESVILHDLYKTAREQIKDDLHKYNNNGFRLIKKGVRANQMDSLAALIMITVGNNVLINLGFTSAVKYIIKNSQASLTQVSFEVGNAIYNQFVYSSSSNNIFNSVKFAKYLISELKVSSKVKDEITSLVLEQKDNLFSPTAQNSLLLKFTLGQTIVNILRSNTKVFSTNAETINKKTEIFISINAVYYHKLNLALLSTTQLPMISPGSSPGVDGQNYLPYLSAATSHFNNISDSVITDNFKNKYRTSELQGLVRTITSLNNVEFKINKAAYNIFMEEWVNPNSLLFKGFNKYLKIDDGAAVKSEKMAHNSRYWQYFNTLKIAGTYIDHVIYFPTFADFRGRIYTYSGYLTYQGSDLARALLLFKGWWCTYWRRVQLYEDIL